MRFKKWNRAQKHTISLRRTDGVGNQRKVVVYYDDLSKAKKPPAWMKELLFPGDAA